MAYIDTGAMTDSSEQWVRSMETVTAGETARIGGIGWEVVTRKTKAALCFVAFAV